jgi:hypothetical protein
MDETSLASPAEYSWSLTVLVHQIGSRLFERNGKAVRNFQKSSSIPCEKMPVHLRDTPLEIRLKAARTECFDAEVYIPRRG